MAKKKYDFSGYATKNGLKCSDGRTIQKDAFKDQDGQTVPLVWQHLHNDPDNVLGHVMLENRNDGVYCYGSFNDSEDAKRAKMLVEHGDISSLSIYANQLQEQSKRVLHGAIREVSLVLAGANPGAKIENISFAHGDGTVTEDETEAIIYTNGSLMHGDTSEPEEDNSMAHEDTNATVADVLDTLTEDQKVVVNYIVAQAVEGSSVAHAASGTASTKTADTSAKTDTKEPTVEDIFNTFTEDQKNVVYYLISEALGNSTDSGTDATHSELEGEKDMKKNVFDQTADSTELNGSSVLSHDQLTAIVTDAKRYGSLRDSFIAHAEDYGFNPIDVLFPDAQDVNGGAPITLSRNTTWVDDVLTNTKHTPFARIRTKIADITAEAARAKGYVTGSLKKEEVISLLKRITTPTTIYKKQKLDRDDMIDITDFDVVVWLKAEMRGLLNEELARAVLISDGRTVADEDKINEMNIRPIAMDDPNVFIQRVQVEHAETTDNIIDECIRARVHYKGTGVPAMYIGTELLTEMLLLKDQFGHRLYKTVQELASVLRVDRIVEVEPMNEATRTSGDNVYDILGIIVNLADYTIGADKGGQVAMFDDFDIDYNQFKYLIETRASGALTMPKSAIVIERKPAAVAP